MKRILAMTAALLLMVSLLGPMVMADRGGNGTGQGDAPQSQGPSGPAGPDRDRQQDRAGDQVQQRDRDQECDDCSNQEREQDADEAANDAKERARVESAGSGAPARSADSDGDDEAPKPGNGNRSEAPPGQAVSGAARNRFANEDETTENVHRVQERIRVEAPDDVEGDDVESDQDVEGDEDADRNDDEKGPRGHYWALQRVLQKHPLPFMMVGQPVTDENGDLVGVDLLRGNRLARDIAPDDTPMEIGDSTQVRLITADGLQVCQLSAQECLAEWLADNPDAYVQVWGRVELDAEGNAVFVAYRITVRIADDDATEPTPTATLPTPTATLPTPTATLPTPTATLPTPTATLPTPTATLPTPTATLPTPTATLPTPTATAAG